MRDSKTDYRPEIDGLRAVAVLAVLFYHADFGWASGGYVGVDVFFVISGYLITSIIVKEIQAKRFSFLRFYERRVRRIYPALYAAMPLILLAAFLLYDPATFASTAKSALATVLFASNFLFWSEAGYFDAPARLKPMLHTWSLAVEEQFYLALPLLLWLLLRYFRPRLKVILAGLAALSFAANVYVLRLDSSAAYYFPHLRAWELLLGSLLAVECFPPIGNRMWRESLSLAGLGMILGSASLYSHGTLFPGEAALLPTLGAAFILHSGTSGGSFVTKALSVSPLAFIGNISYSLYLLHWPIIVFGKYYLIRAATLPETLAMLAAALTLSTLSWKFVETPFRSGARFSRRNIFALAGGAMAATLVLGSAIYFGDGLPQRFADKQLLAVISQPEQEWQEWGRCAENAEQPAEREKFNLCVMGESGAKPSFILWGDSHADVLTPALISAMQKTGKTGYLAVLYGCPPLVGVNNRGVPACFQHNANILKFIQSHPEIQTVILAMRWNALKTPENGKSAGSTLIDKTANSANLHGDAEIFEAGLRRTIKRLQEAGRRVVVVAPIPEIGYNVPPAHFIASRTGRDVNAVIAPTYEEYLEQNRRAFNLLDALRAEYGIEIVFPAEALCGDSICPAVRNGKLLYVDADHLSVFGSRLIARIFDATLENMP